MKAKLEVIQLPIETVLKKLPSPKEKYILMYPIDESAPHGLKRFAFFQEVLLIKGIVFAHCEATELYDAEYINLKRSGNELFKIKRERICQMMSSQPFDISWAFKTTFAPTTIHIWKCDGASKDTAHIYYTVR